MRIYPESLANRKLAKLRKTMSQAEIAKVVKTTQAAICNYETRSRRPADGVRKRFAKLGINEGDWDQ